MNKAMRALAEKKARKRMGRSEGRGHERSESKSYERGEGKSEREGSEHKGY